jgi:RNA polymerase sigma factor (sigma-70 family)
MRSRVADPELEALVTAAQAGDPVAQERLVASQMDRIHAVCSALIRNREVAAELSQESVLRLFKSIPRFRGDCAWTTWSYRIARNLCLNWLEKRREEVGEDGHALEDPGADPLSEVSGDQRRQGVRLALSGALDEQEREAILLHYEGGLAVEEVTRVMGLENRSGARGLLQRARRKLRRELSQEMPEDSIVARAARPTPPAVRAAMEHTLHQLTRVPGRDSEGPEPELSLRPRQALID